MKTLLFCNLIPLKTGAYETLLATIGQEFQKAHDEYVVVFAGEPIPPVADSLRAAGVRWHIMPEWLAREAPPGPQLLSCSVATLLSEEPSDSNSATQQLNNPTTNCRGEAVHPWAFVFPALRLIRQERPDVVAVHFGNELPTLATILLCRVTIVWDRVAKAGKLLGCSVVRLLRNHPKDSLASSPQQLSNPTTHHHPAWRQPRWVWEQDQQIQDPGRLSRWFSKIRLLGLGVDQYLAVYEGGRQSMLKRGIPAEKITVIHNSVAPYVPTRIKGWLREYLGGIQNPESRIQNPAQDEEKSIEQKFTKSTKGEICIFAEGEGKESSSCALCSSVQNTEFDSGIVPQEVLLVTNGSLIPRKRIDFILRVCAALGTGKLLSCQVAELLCESPASPGELLSCSVDKLLSESPKDSPSSTTQQPNNLTTTRACGTTQQPNNLTTGVPWRLLVIGEGPERAKLTALATELGIADRVHFLGLRNDVREILAECDIYLHASKAETCTYAVTESMAAGIPAVMLNAGAAKEQIENGVTGFVIDEADIDAFATCLGAVMGHEIRRMEMGRLAKSRWEDLFLVDLAAIQYHELYLKMKYSNT